MAGNFAVVDKIKIGYAIETTPGTTPNVAFQTVRPKQQSLMFGAKFTESQEFRADRQVSDQILTDASPGGSLAGELSFGTWDDFLYASLQASGWTATTNFSNVSVAGTSAYTVASGGTAVIANMIVRGTGFTNAANNGLYVVASSTGTTITVAGTPLVIESGAATKKLRVWGFTSSSGDITATASGLASTTLNFTTMGLQLYQWIKIGGPLTANQFATAANNGYARITAITNNALTLDNLPTGWGVDAGTGKTIYVQVGDFVRNGVTYTAFTLERWHTDTTVNQYFQFRGYGPDKMVLNLAPGSIIDATWDFKGLSHTETTTSASTGAYVAATTTQVLNAASNIPRVQFGGGAISAPTSKLSITVQNNLREQKGVGTLGNVGIGTGRFHAEVQLEAYFVDNTIYNIYLAGGLTSLSFTVNDTAGNAYVVSLPAVRLTSCTVNAGTINTDVKLALTATALVDTNSGAMIQIDRIPA